MGTSTHIQGFVQKNPYKRTRKLQSIKLQHLYQAQELTTNEHILCCNYHIKHRI